MFRTIWGFWGLLLFFSMCLSVTPLFFILLFILGNRNSRCLIWVANNFFSPIYFLLTLIHIKSCGSENISKDKNYIIVGNHSSIVDFMAHAWSSPVLFKYLSKVENTKIPFFGYLIRHISILVNRKDRTSTRNGYENLKEELGKGFSIFIYPEETRNKKNKPLGDFFPRSF